MLRLFAIRHGEDEVVVSQPRLRTVTRASRTASATVTRKRGMPSMALSLPSNANEMLADTTSETKETSTSLIASSTQQTRPAIILDNILTYCSNRTNNTKQHATIQTQYWKLNCCILYITAQFVTIV